MDYKQKYIKYKLKYLNFNGIARKMTKEKYDKMSHDEKNDFPFYCKNDVPYLCSTKTPNYGLCKNKPNDCLRYDGENTYLEYDLEDENRKKEYEYGKQQGYRLYEEQGHNCSQIEQNSFVNYGINKLMIKQFKIMTYNCWWSYKITGNEEKDNFNREFFEIRINKICDIIKKENPDIVCLQEVGQETFRILIEKLGDNYSYYYPEPFETDNDFNGPKGRNIETFCLTKYPVKSSRLLSIGGNSNIKFPILVLEYDNLIIFNVHLQAGTKNSPGQKDLWFNYSRCRYNQYLSIQKFIIENNINKPMVVLGDFNTNLNGNIHEWYELKALQKLNLKDCWLDKYDNTGGFTEDTNTNSMRWNLKFEEKIFRVDGIFHTDTKIITNRTYIVGNEPINISSEMQENFIKYRVPNDKSELIRYYETDKIQLWPSDHYGVVAELQII